VPLLFGCDSHQIADEGKMAYSDYDAKSLKNRLKCLLPLPNFIVARPTLHDKLRDTHVFGAPSVSMILNLGSGVQNRLPGLINLDIYPHENTDVAGDAHRLPFLAESMDGVWLCAVMEHLRRPFDVADEVFRVLKPDGFVLVTVPFIQPRHGSPYDYFRYTLDGLRSVFNRFQEIEGGASGNGPVGTWAGMTMALAGSLSRRPTISYGLRFLIGWVLYPLAFLDRLIIKKFSDCSVFGGVCYIGRK
jgi:SAM-dependent methyltransferase